jgi:hypothetical protein
MTRIVWLASYPKSGNTWFRMLVANLSATDKPADINAMPENGGIASARGPFDHLTLIDSGLLTYDEIDRLRPLVYEELRRGEPDDEYDATPPAATVRFVKTHDAYTYTDEGAPLLGGAKGADAAILLVRDPRDVASSLASHNHSTIDEAIDFMCDSAAGLFDNTDRRLAQFRQQLHGWSGYQASWLDQADLPLHLVRYEDMHADTEGVLRRALAFAGRSASDEQIARAVAFARFDELKKQELERGFREATNARLGGTFFRRGETGAWRDELAAEQVERIERTHASMIQRLGYRLSSEMAEGEAA